MSLGVPAAQIWGSLVAAFVLLTPPEGAALFPDLPDSQLEQCGAAWCGDSTASTNNTNLQPPDVTKVHKVKLCISSLFGILNMLKRQRINTKMSLIC